MNDDKKPLRSPVEEWLASQLAAHLEPTDPGTPAPAPAPPPPPSLSPPPSPSPRPSLRPSRSPSPSHRRIPPSVPPPRALPVSDLDGTDPDISDPNGPADLAMEDLEIVVDLDDQRTDIRNPAPAPARHAMPPPTPSATPPPRVPPPPSSAADTDAAVLGAWTGIALGVLLFLVVILLAAILLLRAA